MTMKLDESLFTVPGVGRGLRFYVTGATPCPYLDGQMERKAFTHLNQSAPDTLHNQLSEAGFRRSQSVAYRPACPSCNACRSVRVDASQFSPSRNQDRILKRNADLVRRPVAPKATREQFRLLKRYLVSRHEGGGMSDMGFREFAGMVNETPVQTLMFEYREGPEDILRIEQLMKRLGELNPRYTEVVTLRYFAGFTEAETARILEISDRTVRRDWIAARAWLAAHMSEV